MRRPSSLSAVSAVLIVAVLVGCDRNDSTINSVPPVPTVLGSTPAWFNGDVVQLDYTQQFQCDNPPAAGSASGCEMGEEATTSPASPTAIPVLYVMVPLGFRPPDSTLHCPVVGSCVTHPSDIDVSRVFGPGTERNPLPAHSHIIIEEMNHQSVPWALEVIGVKDSATWDRIVATQNLGDVRLMQLEDPDEVHLTGDIPTNTFLFFKVR